MSGILSTTVRPELVEGLHFFARHALRREEEGRCFDGLSTNGEGGK